VPTLKNLEISNNFTVHLKDLEKQQAKPKISKWKELIKGRN
jgi:hypothetical protein